MTRSQQQLILLVALLGVLVAVYARVFRQSPRPPSASTTARVTGSLSPSPSKDAAAARTLPGSSEQRRAQRERSGVLVWSHDPFTRGATTGDLSGLSLSGILWDPQQPVAIINGQTVQVGQELEGYRIIAIGPDRVSVSDGAQTFQLLLSP